MKRQVALELIREFETRNYSVLVTAEPEQCLDLSFDDTGEVADKLDRGELVAFVAHVEVVHKGTGAVLGEDFLGNCIYRTFSEFADHRECGKQNREYAARGENGRCGSYFADMISQAIREARNNYPKMALGQLRKA